MMIIWFFACFTPLIPHIANATHAAGLALGLAWGYLSSLRYR
jgi:membrane associated rhomboid family serine protease